MRQDSNQELDFFEKAAEKIREISAKDYFSERKAFFACQRYVEWDAETLEFIKKTYGGSFLCVEKNEKSLCVAFCHKTGDKVIVHELLGTKDVKESISLLCGFFRVNKALCIIPKEAGERFAMVYPREYADIYFGLGMNF